MGDMVLSASNYITETGVSCRHNYSLIVSKTKATCLHSANNCCDHHRYLHHDESAPKKTSSLFGSSKSDYSNCATRIKTFMFHCQIFDNPLLKYTYRGQVNTTSSVTSDIRSCQVLSKLLKFGCHSVQVQVVVKGRRPTDSIF